MKDAEQPAAHREGTARPARPSPSAAPQRQTDKAQRGEPTAGAEGPPQAWRSSAQEAWPPPAPPGARSRRGDPRGARAGGAAGRHVVPGCRVRRQQGRRGLAPPGVVAGAGRRWGRIRYSRVGVCLWYFRHSPCKSVDRFGTVGVCRWRSSAVERLICNQRVGGSIPSASSNRQDEVGGEAAVRQAFVGARVVARPANEGRGCERRARAIGTTDGEVAKRSNATDCKSVAPRASKVRILPSPPSIASATKGRDRDKGVEAGVAQLVELQPSKLDVAGSNPVARSTWRRRGGFGGEAVGEFRQRPRSSVGRARPW